MIRLNDFGGFGDLLNQGSNGNVVSIRRGQGGSILRVTSLILAMRTTVAGPVYSRVIAIDGDLDYAGWSQAVALKWNTASVVPGLRNFISSEGKVLADFVVSNADPAIVNPFGIKPWRCLTGIFTLVMGAAYTQAGVIDANAFGYLTVDGEEEQAAQSDVTLARVKLR